MYIELEIINNWFAFILDFSPVLTIFVSLIYQKRDNFKTKLFPGLFFS